MAPSHVDTRIVWLALICFGAGFHGTAAAQFPMAGGNPQRTGFTTHAGPIANPEVAWEAALGLEGDCATQPILDAQGNIYVTGAPSNAAHGATAKSATGALVSLDPQGHERWRYSWSWDTALHGGSSSQLSVPVLTPGNHIVMGFRLGWLRCFNRNTGALIWEKNLSPEGDPITSAPVVDHEGFIYVYVRDTRVLNKFDSASGTLVWTQPFPDAGKGNASSPALSPDQKTLYIGRTGNSVGYLYAMNAADGAFKWAWSPESAKSHSFAWSVPIVDAKGVIHIQDEEDARIYAIRDLGRVHAIAWAYKKNGSGAPRLAAAHDDCLFSSYSTSHPVVVALGPDGAEKWAHPLDEGGSIGGMAVTESALYFAVDGTGKVYALNPRSGKTLWTKTVAPAESSFSEGVTPAPNGALYLGVAGTTSHPKEAVVVALKASP